MSALDKFRAKKAALAATAKIKLPANATAPASTAPSRAPLPPVGGIGGVVAPGAAAIAAPVAAPDPLTSIRPETLKEITEAFLVVLTGDLIVPTDSRALLGKLQRQQRGRAGVVSAHSHCKSKHSARFSQTWLKDPAVPLQLCVERILRDLASKVRASVSRAILNASCRVVCLSRNTSSWLSKPRQMNRWS